MFPMRRRHAELELEIPDEIRHHIGVLLDLLEARDFFERASDVGEGDGEVEGACG